MLDEARYTATPTHWSQVTLHLVNNLFRYSFVIDIRIRVVENTQEFENCELEFLT